MSTTILFPRRRLGFQSLQTAKSEQTCLTRLSLIAIANLLPGDQLPFAKGTIVVVDNTDAHLQYDFIRPDGHTTREVIEATQIMASSILVAFQKKIPELSPSYSHPLCQVIERDPSIYRLRTQTGWVINDALSVMTGNIIYPIGPGPGLRSATPDEVFPPVCPIPTQSQTADEQLSTAKTDTPNVSEETSVTETAIDRPVAPKTSLMNQQESFVF